MGAFKLDLMTLLVIFVVISVFFTMSSGHKESQPVAPVTSTEKPVVQGMSQNSNAEFSTASFKKLSPKVNSSRFSTRTWS